jgi:hypothetical protein
VPQSELSGTSISSKCLPLMKRQAPARVKNELRTALLISFGLAFVLFSGALIARMYL